MEVSYPWHIFITTKRRKTNLKNVHFVLIIKKEGQQKKLKEPDAPVAPKNFEADKWAEEPTDNDIPF